MFGPALLASVLAPAVVAWGVPPSVPPPEPFPPPLFGRDTVLDLGRVEGEPRHEVVHRIVRRYIKEVKYCYQPELLRQPDLAGKITVQLTIGASGQVLASKLAGSTMGNARVESCTVAAVRRWWFPKPLGGGTVVVNTSFTLTPTRPIELVAGKNGAGAVEIEAIGEKVFVHRSTDANAVTSNGLVVVTEGTLLLVDTAWTEPQTEAILDWGDREYGRPWSAVITHDHNDRNGGLAALQRRNIPVAAVDLTVAKMAARGVRGVTPLFLARDGSFKDFRGFEAFYPGPGHASDNIVLRFPGLVYGGCLVKSMAATDLGFTGDANLAAWPAAIVNVRARFGDRAIVPGHGPVDLSGQAFNHTLDLLGAVKKR